MAIFTDPKDFHKNCWAWRTAGYRTAFVPTMGAFHEGHRALMSWARSHADKVAVSIFVNPTQFGSSEDLASYPRDLERDRQIATELKIDAIFAPEPEAMFKPDHCTWIEVPELTKTLCGPKRPEHFLGVATVVAKLLALALPDVAVFGQKDWQQLAIIRRMVRDLNFPVVIAGRPTEREKDGLAFSSRNAYLTRDQRKLAPNIYKGLMRSAAALVEGVTDAATLEAELRAFYSQNLPAGRVEYIECVHPDTLEPLTTIDDQALLAVAVALGKARLIDNILLGV